MNVLESSPLKARVSVRRLAVGVRVRTLAPENLDSAPSAKRNASHHEYSKAARGSHLSSACFLRAPRIIWQLTMILDAINNA